ncbi:MAG: hypothetical protein IOC82_03375 [Aestuariivirga sp.]|uniref:hypothetical protein n=1 Tax=Aestuariivirga sp. TaxID=2650926 RepID=UPI0025C17FA5|nr:hypothetical protein [Aestuariivirga sp.]MCA3560056.1 hypothetical protein [Aestuariivirga sp.]
MNRRSATAKSRRKIHPADAANAAILARAVRFDVALFLGTGRHARASAPTLGEARIEAMRLVAENPSPFGKRLPLIYGVTAEGRSALVTSN